jgi:hypothetical protein
VRVTLTGQGLISARDSMRAALRSLLVDHEVTQSALARQLTDKARQFGLKRGDPGRDVRYDPAMVNRWLDGKLVMSRQAAWLLDMLYTDIGDETFQDMRDRYVLASDRDQVPDPAPAAERPLLEGTQCAAEFLANSRPHRKLGLADDETMAIVLLSVVDTIEARQIVSAVVNRTPEVRAIAMYDVLGHWDVAVKLAAPTGYDLAAFYAEVHDELVANDMAGPDENPTEEIVEFTGHRFLLTDASRIKKPGSTKPPSFLILDKPEDYDLLRVQRAFLFVELKTVPELRRAIAQRSVERVISGDDMPLACRNIIEAITFSDDAVIIEVAMTCANGIRRLNQLNRIVGRELTRFKAQKYNLTVFEADERGWTTNTA